MNNRDTTTSDAGMRWLINHSALAYANQWFVTDREFMAGLGSSDTNEIDTALLGKLAAKYMVARGFKKAADTAVSADDVRWAAAAVHLKESAVSSRQIADEVHLLAAKLGKVAPKAGQTEQRLISAATKFLWFCGKHNVRILDKRAVLALVRFGYPRTIGANYGSFARAWQEQFNMLIEEMRDAVAQLPDQLKWTCIDPRYHDEAIAVFKQDWFLDRVFDKYLWTIGASEGSATSFV